MDKQGQSGCAPEPPDADLERLLDQASSAPESPWFVARTIHRITDTRQESWLAGLGKFLTRPVAWGGAAAGLMLLLFFWQAPPSPDGGAVGAGIVTDSDLEVIANLDFLLADLEADLWTNAFSASF